MRRRRWRLRAITSAIWALAALTWGTIGHYFVGLPDIGPILAGVAVAAVLMWPATERRPLRTYQSRRSAARTTNA
jgi:hypothetical protein